MLYYTNRAEAAACSLYMPCTPLQGAAAPLPAGLGYMYTEQARSKQILTGQARKWARQRGVLGSNYIAIQNYQNDISYEQPIDKAT